MRKNKKRELKSYGKARAPFTTTDSPVRVEGADQSSIVSAVLAIAVAVLSSFTSSVEPTKGLGVGEGCLGSSPGFTITQMGGSGKIPQPLRAPLFFLVNLE